MGISRREAYAILFLSLVEHIFNVPVGVLNTQPVVENKSGLRLVGRRLRRARCCAAMAGHRAGDQRRRGDHPHAALACTWCSNTVYAASLAGMSIVAMVVHMWAEPIENMGIAVPIFMPPIISAVVAMLLSRITPRLAYVWAAWER